MLSVTAKQLARRTTAGSASCAATTCYYSSIGRLSSSSSSLVHQQQQQQQPASFASSSLSIRTYISRAHPQKIPDFPAPEAFQLVLDEVEKRKKLKAIRWKRNIKQRAKHGKVDDGGPYRPRDETIELAVNLNVDPRKPGQALRGSLALPHGTGRRVNVAVFTEDPELAAKAKEMGALHVGGESLMDQIVKGDVSVDSFQRALATSDVMGDLTKKLARVLGPRGLMPNPKVGTVAPSSEDLLQLLETQLAGKEIQYRTEKEGILHFRLGKGSFGKDNLLENAGAVMNKVFEIKPESYGKSKKKKGGGGGKKKGGASMETYVISAYVCSTNTKSVKIDTRTLDPSSAFFLTAIEK